MKIKKIKLKNYKQYKGEQLINIPKDDKIIIIKGENGSGKTNLLNGLTWVFYNDEDRDNKKLFNDDIIYSIKDGNEDNMFIEVHFNNSNKFHILKREIIAKKNNENKFSFKEIYTLNIMDNGESIIIDDNIEIENYINNILNYSVKDYFFFDGSKIEQFTKDDHNEDVKKAIKNLLKIEAIKRSRDHIRRIIDDIRRVINDESLDKELNEMDDKINKINNEIKLLENEKGKTKNNINNIEKNINNTLNELESLENNSNLKQKKENFKKQLKQIKEDIENKRTDLSKYLNNAYLIFAHNIFEDTVNYINTELSNEKNKIPGSVYKNIIRKTINKRECIVCESTLNAEKLDILHKKLPKVKIEETETRQFQELINKINIAKEKRKHSYEKITILKSDINDLEKEKRKVEESIDAYDQRIDNELPDAKKSREMLEKFNEAKDNAKEKLFSIKQKLEVLYKKLGEVENKHKELSEKSKVNEFNNLKLDKAYKIREELNNIFNSYETAEIKKINSKTKEIFDAIIRKENVFKNIYIDDNYNLNIYRGYDENILDELSYGERQILSLSLILALATVSDDVGAFVMDTPMGNLDPIHRRKLMKNIPDFVDQLFLLVTSSEFTSDLYDVCNKYISNEYRLKTKPNGNTELIKEEII